MLDEGHAFCSLGEREFGGREAAWHAVFKSSILESRTLDHGFEFSLVANPGVFSELQRLAGFENECCGWMKIDIRDGDPILLRMTTEAIGGTDIIRLLIRDAVKIDGSPGKDHT